MYLASSDQSWEFTQCCVKLFIETDAKGVLEGGYVLIFNVKDIAVVLGDDTSLLAKSVCATLQDPDLLVVRSALELLLVYFPLSIQFVLVLCRIFKADDLEEIVKAALAVVLRKDMSLNRRLYAWLDSNNGLSNDETTREILIKATKSLFSVRSNVESEQDNLNKQDESNVSESNQIKTKSNQKGSESDLLESKSDLLQSKSDQLESKSDLLESKSDQIESKQMQVDPRKSFKILIALLDKQEIASIILSSTLLSILSFALSTNTQSQMQMLTSYLDPMQLYTAFNRNSSKYTLIQGFYSEIQSEVDEESARVHIPLLLLKISSSRATSVESLRLCNTLFSKSDFSAEWRVEYKDGLVISRTNEDSEDEVDADILYSAADTRLVVGRGVRGQILGHTLEIVERVCVNPCLALLDAACEMLTHALSNSSTQDKGWIDALLRCTTESFEITERAIATIVGLLRGKSMPEQVARSILAGV